MQIRTAEQKDLQELLSIYNQAITDGNCTTDTCHLNVEDRQEWFHSHSPHKYPIFVMEQHVRGDITGWCSLSAYRRGRMALKNVANLSMAGKCNDERIALS